MIPRPAKITAPPMPTTTPITVLRVLVLMPLELVLPLVLARLLVEDDTSEEMVDEEMLVTALPEMVWTMVLMKTDSDTLDDFGGAVVDAVVEVCVLDVVLEDEASVVLWVVDGGAVGVGVLVVCSAVVLVVLVEESALVWLAVVLVVSVDVVLVCEVLDSLLVEDGVVDDFAAPPLATVFVFDGSALASMGSDTSVAGARLKRPNQEAWIWVREIRRTKRESSRR